MKPSMAFARPSMDVSRSYLFAKRSVDLIAAMLILVLLSPVWLILAISVKATSPGPAFFRRTVIGQGGRRFTYYKFRTMRPGDDSHHREWLKEFVTRDSAYTGNEFKVRNDPRVTSVGRFLRRTSLDEVPQLINVLKGDMSLVGPRPPIEYEYELYDETAKGRLAVKPGITGLYQVTARSRVPFSKMLELDLEYIKRRSIWLDLAIIFRTPIAIITGRGAG
jgi:lipopolysaccharide/colanic/teichoic acid biosynthesis glycosyltransferase